MKLIADESVDRPIIDALRLAGHEVYSVTENCPGVTDDIVLTKAVERQSLLMTLDKDFGELVYRLGRAHFGIVLIRMHGVPADVKASQIVDVMQRIDVDWANSFVIILPGSLRVRRLR